MRYLLYILFLCLCGTYVLSATEFFVDGSSPHEPQDGSRERPFKTIMQAIKAPVQGAKTITVADGVYREAVLIHRKRGKEKFVLQAAPGARPTLSGYQHVTQWTQGDDGLYRTTVDFIPKSLLINGDYMPMARFPETGWLSMAFTGKTTFTSPVTRPIAPGAICYTWYSRGNIFLSLKLKASPQPGSYELEPCRLQLGNNEHCFFFNHPSLATQPGQWGWTKKADKSYEVFLRLDQPLSACTIDIAGGHAPLTIRDSNHVEVRGFNVMGSTLHGVWINGSNDVKLSQMGVYWSKAGMWIRGCENILLEDCRLSCNQGGLSFMNDTGITVRKCDIGYNFEDGVNIGWHVKNATVEGCRIHHHIWWGHPDGIQFFRFVDGVTIRDNVIFGNGQCIMTEDLKNVTCVNNLIAGSAGVQVIWGHGSTDHVTMANNTLLASNFSSMVITGVDYSLTNNVISNMYFQGKYPDRKYRGRDNLFINRHKRWNASYESVRYTSFDSYAKAVGEIDGAVQQSPVRGTPVTMGGINSKTLWQCTPQKIILGNIQPNSFKVGDTIEIAFDGIPRTITDVDGNAVTFTPALPYHPIHNYIVFNWGNQKDMTWNPQLIRQNGSSLSYEHFRKDTITSVPMPAAVKNFIRHVDRKIPPHRF